MTSVENYKQYGQVDFHGQIMTSDATMLTSVSLSLPSCELSFYTCGHLVFTAETP